MDIFIFSDESNEFFSLRRRGRSLGHRNTKDPSVSGRVAWWCGELPGPMSEVFIFHLL